MSKTPRIIALAPTQTVITSNSFTNGTTVVTPLSYLAPAGCKSIKVRYVAAGGGTSGSGTSGATAGGAGGNTSFNGVVANGGSVTLAGGTGGTGTANLRIPGGTGGIAAQNGSYGLGGAGGGSILGFPTPPKAAVTVGTAVTGTSPTTGYGGGASSPSGDLSTYGGSNGAGGGEYVELIISGTALLSAIPFSVGAGGTAGAPNGAAGIGGVIIVEERYGY